MFPAPTRRARTNLMLSVKDTLRAATGNLQLENRSLRRGALQCLARAGAPLATMLNFSGHSNVNSLKRYLNFGRIMPDEHRKAEPFLARLTEVRADQQGAVRSC